jgi:hypothetical protein
LSQLVLHHYPNSPFSEKIRLILGFKSLHWTSVHIPAIMPKPDVVALLALIWIFGRETRGRDLRELESAAGARTDPLQS